MAKSAISESAREEEERKIMQKDPKMLEIVLSKERTIETKMRTSISLGQTAIALAALGFGIMAVFGKSNVIYIGAIVVGLALLLGWSAVKRYNHYRAELKKLEKHHASLEEIVYDDGTIEK